jgi:hypothetical protein
MTRPTTRLAAATALMSLLAWGPGIRGQGATLGTFRWQLQPFCNAVVVTVTQQGGSYTVDGFDDQCGAPQRAPLVGLATPNPDGSIGLGLHVVTVPGGRGLDIAARISLATLGGPWTDSAGNSGTLAFGAATGGAPRPTPTIPAAAIAAAAIGAAAINAAQVQTRLVGACSKEQAVEAVRPGGVVACTDVERVVDVLATPLLYADIAIGADGLAVMAHQDFAVRGLRVTHCGSPACIVRNVSTTVDDTTAPVGAEPSIAIGSDGLPIIAHEEARAVGSTLRLTHCSDVTCANGSVSTSLAGFLQASLGIRPSLAIGSDGLPIVSHSESTPAGARLWVTHCANPVCTSMDSTVQIDDISTDVGSYGSAIAIGNDGLPVVSYHQGASAGALRVTHCGNRTCSAGNVSTTVDDPADDVGHESAIRIGADGLPVIGHGDVTAGALRVTHCGNATCSAGNVSTTVDAPPVAAGVRPALAIGADGLPVLSHLYPLNAAGAVRVTHCGNPACTGGNVSTVVAADSAAIDTGIAIAPDGLPIVTLLDLRGYALRVVKCGERDCR